VLGQREQGVAYEGCRGLGPGDVEEKGHVGGHLVRRFPGEAFLPRSVQYVGDPAARRILPAPTDRRPDVSPELLQRGDGRRRHPRVADLARHEPRRRPGHHLDVPAREPQPLADDHGRQRVREAAGQIHPIVLLLQPVQQPPDLGPYLRLVGRPDGLRREELPDHLPHPRVHRRIRRYKVPGLAGAEHLVGPVEVVALGVGEGPPIARRRLYVVIARQDPQVVGRVVIHGRLRPQPAVDRIRVLPRLQRERIVQNRAHALPPIAPWPRHLTTNNDSNILDPTSWERTLEGYGARRGVWTG